MILMASIICVFADCLKFFFCISSSFLWRSLTKDGSYQFCNDFLVSLLRINLLKANDFKDV